MAAYGPEQHSANEYDQATTQIDQGQELGADPPLWLVILTPEQEAALDAEAQAERELEL